MYMLVYGSSFPRCSRPQNPPHPRHFFIVLTRHGEVGLVNNIQSPPPCDTPSLAVTSIPQPLISGPSAAPARASAASPDPPPSRIPYRPASFSPVNVNGARAAGCVTKYGPPFGVSFGSTRMWRLCSEQGWNAVMCSGECWYLYLQVSYLSDS